MNFQTGSKVERIQLYENTGGNPLIIRWVAGQLGRGKCRTIADALKLLQQAPEGEAALEFIFGDIATGFTPNETKVLAALSHFSTPMQVKFIAELAELGNIAAQMALEDLSGRALVTGIEENTRFVMTPLVADFLRRARPEAVKQTGNKLCDWAYAMAVENGYNEYDRFPKLDAAWPQIAAALPILIGGDNTRLQTVCEALFHFLDFSGRWDEALSFSRQAEEKAVSAKEFYKAGEQAHRIGWVFNLLGQSADVLECADRVEKHWQKAKAGVHEMAVALHLRGHGHRIARDYPAAITAYSKAVELWRSLSPQSWNVAVGLNSLAEAQRYSQIFDEAEKNYHEAIRIAKVVGSVAGVAAYNSNLVALALQREDWAGAEKLARGALPLAEKMGRKELIAKNYSYLAKALARQNQKAEGLSYAQKAVDILTQLHSPDLPWTQGVFKECQS